MIKKEDLETALTVVSQMIRKAEHESEHFILSDARTLIINEIDATYNESIKHKAPVREDSERDLSLPIAESGISGSARKVG